MTSGAKDKWRAAVILVAGIAIAAAIYWIIQAVVQLLGAVS